MARNLIVVAFASLAVTAASCSRATPGPRTYATPEEAVRALSDSVKAGKLEELLAIFGPDSKELVDSSDPATARENRQVFAVAFREKWQLVDQGANTKVLVIGNEEWPFPVPLVRQANGWQFDTAAGKEEIIARRIGRNELAVMQICRTYVAAQRLYARDGHDGKRAGLFATAFRSDSGKQNGLYWPAGHGQRRSPLGDLAAQAAEEGRVSAGSPPAPFHGYQFKILTAQGAAAAGGAKNYVTAGDMSGGFALVAWPAQYDATGVMTFIINQDGVLYEKDLGPDTAAMAKAMSLYDPDPSWVKVQ